MSNISPDQFQDFFIVLCTMSLRATFLLVAFLLVHRVVGSWLRARWRYMLWGLLLIPMLVPWGISTPLFSQVFGGLDALSSQTLPNNTPGIETVALSPAGSLAPGLAETSPKEMTQSSVSKAVDHSTGYNSGFALFAVIWSIGMVVLLIRLLVKSAKLTRDALQDATMAPSWIQDAFEAARRELTPKSWPILIVTQHVSSPVLLGALRPKVLLPASLVEKVSPEALRHLFLHELTHLKRGDIWANWLWSLTLCIHWFNPMLWFAGRCIARDRELACDESVLDTLPTNTQRIDYGQALLAITRYTGPIQRSAGWVGILENQPMLKRRIKMIANYRHATIRHTIAGVLFMFGLGALALVTSAEGSDKTLNASDAELMGRVEHFFLNNFRDVSARKSIEWGHVETDSDGNRSIRYQYLATIWDREKKVMNQRFTFDEKGIFVKVEDLGGKNQLDDSSAEVQKLRQKIQPFIDEGRFAEAIAILEKAGQSNVNVWQATSAMIIEVKRQGGLVLSNSETKIVARQNIEDTSWDSSTDEGMQKLVEYFFSRNYRDITARKTLDWGKAGTDKDGNRFIRYKYEATIWDKDVIVQNKVFTFTPAGEYVSVKDVA